jgi:hypothetical protein
MILDSNESFFEGIKKKKIIRRNERERRESNGNICVPAK